VVKQPHTLRHYRQNVTRDIKFFCHLYCNNLVLKLREAVLLRSALSGLIIMCLSRFVAWGRPHQSYILGELVEEHEVIDGGHGLKFNMNEVQQLIIGGLFYRNYATIMAMPWIVWCKWMELWRKCLVIVELQSAADKCFDQRWSLSKSRLMHEFWTCWICTHLFLLADPMIEIMTNTSFSKCRLHVLL
jgi:hypothetical protein